jgi:hypothetical protein
VFEVQRRAVVGSLAFEKDERLSQRGSPWRIVTVQGDQTTPLERDQDDR